MLVVQILQPQRWLWFNKYLFFSFFLKEKEKMVYLPFCSVTLEIKFLNHSQWASQVSNQADVTNVIPLQVCHLCRWASRAWVQAFTCLLPPTLSWTHTWACSSPRPLTVGQYLLLLEHHFFFTNSNSSNSSSIREIQKIWYTWIRTKHGIDDLYHNQILFFIWFIFCFNFLFWPTT